MKFLTAVIFSLFTLTIVAQKKVHLLIGTYTNGKSEGIYVYDFNTSNASNKYISSIKSSNPSFLAVSPNKKFVYAVNEDGDSLNNGGAVSSYSFNKNSGSLQYINQQKSGGNHPCYITTDNSGKWIITANYSGGSFAVMEANNDGSIAAAKTIVQHSGKSVNSSRQEKAHVHTTVLTNDNKNLLVADLGMDKLLVYPFNAESGNISKNEVKTTSVIGGAGPRHLAIHPSQKFVYLTQELNGTIGAFSISANGTLKLLQTISAVPEGYTGSFGGADIHVSLNGKFLYASNRGESNSIAIFSINQITGSLTSIGHQSTFGGKPRNFNFDPSGNFLLVANQDTDNIVIFSINHQTGLLKDTGKRINVPAPVCIKWID
jgi:6-phosphogluconolactonase